MSLSGTKRVDVPASMSVVGSQLIGPYGCSPSGHRIQPNVCGCRESCIACAAPVSRALWRR